MHLEAGRAEEKIRKTIRTLDRTHRVLVDRQRKCERSGDVSGYRQAVAEEAAVTAARNRLNNALGRMNYAG